MNDKIASANKANGIEFFKVKTADGIEMDGWMVKPRNFDSERKYPVVFYVYTEPWGQNVKDQFGIADNFLYKGDMAIPASSIAGRCYGQYWVYRKCIFQKTLQS